NTTFNNGADGDDGAGILLDNYSAKIDMNNIDITGNIFFAKTPKQNTGYFSFKGGIPATISLNNNYYVKPIDENKSIFTNIGGTYNYRTLQNWKSWSGKDGNSKNSPKSITDLNDLRFEY